MVDIFIEWRAWWKSNIQEYSLFEGEKKYMHKYFERKVYKYFLLAVETQRSISRTLNFPTH